MTEKNIRKLLENEEPNKLEVLEVKEILPESIWETYSAFANSDGGTILLGIVEEPDHEKISTTYNIIGVDSPESIEREFLNTLYTDKVSANIITNRNIGITDVDDKSIIWIDVPPADYRVKPVYVNENPFKGTFKRNYLGNYHASIDEIDAMVRDQQRQSTDSEILVGYTFDDIDEEALKKFRRIFESKYPNHVWNKNDDVTFLKNLGGYAVDRKTGKSWLTTAGLLMFGKGVSVREKFGDVQMEYINRINPLVYQNWGKELKYDGSWETNLFNYIYNVMSNLKGGFTSIAEDDADEVSQRRFDSLLRKILINMVAQSDFKLGGSLRVLTNDFGVIFSSPGSLLLKPGPPFESSVSKVRNPRLKTMTEITLSDKNRRIIPTNILKVCEEQNWRLPDLSFNSQTGQNELKLWRRPIESSESLGDVPDGYSTGYNQLDSDSKMILSILFSESAVDLNRLATLTAMNKIKLNEILSELIRKGFVISKTDDFGTKYNIDYLRLKDRAEINPKKMGHELSGGIFSKNERAILEALSDIELITAEDAIRLTEVNSLAGAHKLLGRLIDRGYLTKEKVGKVYHYSLRKRQEE